MRDMERVPTFGVGKESKGHVADDTPRPVKELRGALRGVLGGLLRQTLDRYEAVIESDRQFDIIKKLTMNDFGDCERATSAIVTRILVKETRNGSGDSADADNGTGTV